MDKVPRTQQLFPPQSPGQWKAYWRGQNQEWRTEPEINMARQEELNTLRTSRMNEAQSMYPFKDRRLDRADIEWLLATHKSSNLIGPIDYTDEQQWKRAGIDISGATLSRENLSGLPMTGMIAGNIFQGTTAAKKNSVKTNLEKANLVGSHLESAKLMGANLTKAVLSEAYLDEAQLNEAHLEGAILTEVHLKDADCTNAYLAGANAYRAYAEEIIFREAHLERANFSEAHLEGADLRGVVLNKTKFNRAFLEGADFRDAHVDLEGADFSYAHLEGANFAGAQLPRASFRGAHLEGANFTDALLEDTDFTDSYLAGADFRNAHLEGADLRRAYLQGKKLDTSDRARISNWSPSFPEIIPPADFREAFFSSATRLKDAVLGNKELGFIFVADLNWSDVNLNVINWDHFLRPGDEDRAKKSRYAGNDRISQIDEYSGAVRANRQLAVILQNQGLDEVAARFSYRGQVLQRTVLRQQKRIPQYLFSLILYLLTGYGYKPLRSFVAYLIVDIIFMFIYHFLDPNLNYLDAFIVSATTFGRGLTPSANLTEAMELFSIAQAFIGLIIEATFIAALTQRLFGK